MQQQRALLQIDQVTHRWFKFRRRINTRTNRQIMDFADGQLNFRRSALLNGFRQLGDQQMINDWRFGQTPDKQQ